MNKQFNPWQKIKCLILDVDGICTDGKLYYGPNGESTKVFHVLDGQGISAIRNIGIEVAIISGRNSAMVTKRFESLGVKHIYQGKTDKLPTYKYLMEKLKLSQTEVAYMGDDVPDVPLLKLAAIGISVKNAHQSALAACDYICKNAGGHGAVREICDLIIQHHKKA